MIKLKDLIRENFEEFLRGMKDQIDALNAKADARYKQIYDQHVGMWTDNGRSDPRQNTMFGQPSNAAHQMALQDGDYRLLKRDALNLEARYRTLERRYKKQQNRKK